MRGARNAARVINVVTLGLVRGGMRLSGRLATLPDVRSARRLLMRTLGMSPRDVTHLVQEQGPDAVRDHTRKAVSKMLGGRNHAEEKPGAEGKE